MQVSKARSATTSVILFCFTVVLFQPLLSAPFINIDDPQYVTGNLMVREGLSLRSISWAFSTLHYGNYCPVNWISHMFDMQIFGEWSGGHHLTNIVLHALTGVMLYLFLASVTGESFLALATAFCFLAHPVHVEPVAWVASRKDVLSGFFAVAALIAYGWYVKRPSWIRYALFFFLFLLGILTKSVLVMFPLVLLATDIWPLSRLRIDSFTKGAVFRLLIEKLPLFAVSLVMAFITYYAQESIGAIDPLADDAPAIVRVLDVAGRYLFYLQNFVWPFELFFPYGKLNTSLTFDGIALVALIAATVGAIANAKKQPSFLFGWCWFVFFLLPYSQFSRIGLQEVSDRWSYLPLIGISILLFSACRSKVLKGAASVALVAMTALTVQQIAFWKDELSLFSRAVALDPANALAYRYRGAAYLYRGRFHEQANDPEKALDDFVQSQRFDSNAFVFERIAVTLQRLGREKSLPEYLPQESSAGPLASRERGRRLAVLAGYPTAAKRYRDMVGRDPLEEGIDTLQRAHTEDPLDDVTTRHLALALLSAKKYDEARALIEPLGSRRPNSAMLTNEIGVVFARSGRWREALPYFSRAAWLNPADEGVRVNLSNANAALGNREIALTAAKEALQISPDYSPALLAQATAEFGLGKIDDALKSFEGVLRLNPNSAEAWNGRGTIQYMKGEFSSAVTAFDNCIAINASLPDAFLNRGVTWLKIGNVTAARSDLKRALELNPSLKDAQAILNNIGNNG